ncbi:hypothetical protein Tco_0540287 [Tanacetum coccineum]
MPIFMEIFQLLILPYVEYQSVILIPYKAVIEEMDDSLVRASTPASSLEEDSGGGPKRQETIGDTIAQTSLKRRVKRLEKKGWPRTHGLKRLYKIGLSRRVVSSDKEGLGKEDATKQERIADIDADAGINLVSTHFDVDTDMFGVHDLVGDEVVVERINLVNTHFDVDTDMFGVLDLVGDEVVVESEVVVKAASTIPVSAATTTTTVITDDEITLAKALAELKSAKLPTITTATTITAASTRPKAKRIIIHEQEQAPTPTVSSQQPSQLNVQDKGKGKMVEPEPVKKLLKKDQLMLDKELFKEIAQDSTELEQESIKKQKVDEDKEIAKLLRLIKIVPDEEGVAIDAIPLATKPPSIVDYKIHKEGEDLETLWKLVKAKHGSTRPKEGYERVLCGDLKTMFNPHAEDQVWRNQQDYRVLDWKIYDSCRVHSLRLQHMHIHMLVEKRYPLTPATITDMLNKKLQCDHFNKMVYQLLKLHKTDQESMKCLEASSR